MGAYESAMNFVKELEKKGSTLEERIIALARLVILALDDVKDDVWEGVKQGASERYKGIWYEKPQDNDEIVEEVSVDSLLEHILKDSRIVEKTGGLTKSSLMNNAKINMVLTYIAPHELAFTKKLPYCYAYGEEKIVAYKRR